MWRRGRGARGSCTAGGVPNEPTTADELRGDPVKTHMHNNKGCVVEADGKGFGGERAMAPFVKSRRQRSARADDPVEVLCAEAVRRVATGDRVGAWRVATSRATASAFFVLLLLGNGCVTEWPASLLWNWLLWCCFNRGATFATAGVRRVTRILMLKSRWSTLFATRTLFRRWRLLPAGLGIDLGVGLGATGAFAALAPTGCSWEFFPWNNSFGRQLDISVLGSM